MVEMIVEWLADRGHPVIDQFKSTMNKTHQICRMSHFNLIIKLDQIIALRHGHVGTEAIIHFHDPFMFDKLGELFPVKNG